MAKLTDIKQKILQLEGGAFQEFCDIYLAKIGYSGICSLGMKAGSQKTTKGIPDTYFIKAHDKYIFVMYTTQQSNFYKKVSEDIYDCLNPEKTGVELKKVSEIIYCHTSTNLSAGEDKILRELCETKGILLQIKGIDEIANDIYIHYHGIARNFLGVSISTGQILSYDEFISTYDSNSMAAKLSTTFQFREKETEEILFKMENSDITIISGMAGVGKTRLALECCKKYEIKTGYKLFCIQSNNLPIYDDLKVYLDTPGKYLLMIDDANQMTGLRYILQYITKKAQGFDVKIVITVRDYAKKNIIQDVYEYAAPEICRINVFSDEEITDILKVNLGIINSDYLEKIVKIAEGNVRIAIIAGKFAVETQSFKKINDATGLYEKYYGKILKEIVIKQDKNLFATAGIIAFFTAINIDNLNMLKPVLKLIGISTKTFVDYAYKLHELELVDIYCDKAVKISDQCFSNYLLNYVFIQEKIISFSIIIKEFFKRYKSEVINATNILANIFASDNVHKQLKNEIGIVWDDYKLSQNPMFFEFVKAFHEIRPLETLLIIKEKIDALSYESFNVNTINFEKERQNSRVNDDILEILGGFRDGQNLTDAIDLLLLYYEKQPQRFMDCFHTIISSYG